MKKWTKIAKAIKEELGIEGRTGKQCRERWHNHLNPDIVKETWTAEEESKIFELQNQLGNRWSEIATYLPGRTDNSIKNCFYSAIRRNLRKYNKKRSESEKLKGSIKSLLRKPSNKAILMRGNLENTDKTEDKRKLSENKPNDIVCPSIQPFTPLSIFHYPITPSTVSSAGSTNYILRSFKFPEDFISSCDIEGQTEVYQYEPGAFNYFMPQLTPPNSIPFFFTPRNSN